MGWHTLRGMSHPSVARTSLLSPRAMAGLRASPQRAAAVFSQAIVSAYWGAPWWRYIDLQHPTAQASGGPAMSINLSPLAQRCGIEARSAMPVVGPRDQRRWRRALVVALAGLALWAPYAHAQGPPSPRAPDVIGQPTTQEPTQAELDKADVDPNHWLMFNKGYLGYRYAKLTQINTHNVRQLQPECSFKLGEQGSFQGGPLVYGRVLYITSAFG